MTTAGASSDARHLVYLSPPRLSLLFLLLLFSSRCWLVSFPFSPLFSLLINILVVGGDVRAVCQHVRGVGGVGGFGSVAVSVALVQSRMSVVSVAVVVVVLVVVVMIMVVVVVSSWWSWAWWCMVVVVIVVIVVVVVAGVATHCMRFPYQWRISSPDQDTSD